MAPVLAITLLLGGPALADPVVEVRPAMGERAPAGSCAGRWTGTARDDHGGGPGAPYGLTVEVFGTSATCGTIEYALGCGGWLRDCRVEGGRLVAVEAYTHNPGTCAPEGRVELTCAGDGMDLVWRTLAGTAWPVTTGSLHREAAAVPRAPTSVPAGCGCATGPSAALVLPLALLGRRRPRRRA